MPLVLLQVKSYSWQRLPAPEQHCLRAGQGSPSPGEGKFPAGTLQWGRAGLQPCCRGGVWQGLRRGHLPHGSGDRLSADAARPFATARHSDPVCCLLSLVSGFPSQRNAVKLGGAYQSHAFPFPYQCHPRQEQERLDGVKSLNACQG